MSSVRQVPSPPVLALPEAASGSPQGAAGLSTDGRIVRVGSFRSMPSPSMQFADQHSFALAGTVVAASSSVTPAADGRKLRERAASDAMREAFKTAERSALRLIQRYRKDLVRSMPSQHGPHAAACRRLANILEPLLGGLAGSSNRGDTTVAQLLSGTSDLLSDIAAGRNLQITPERLDDIEVQVAIVTSRQVVRLDTQFRAAFDAILETDASLGHAAPDAGNELDEPFGDIRMDYANAIARLRASGDTAAAVDLIEALPVPGLGGQDTPPPATGSAPIPMPISPQQAIGIVAACKTMLQEDLAFINSFQSGEDMVMEIATLAVAHGRALLPDADA